jgi:hypothetical protein
MSSDRIATICVAMTVIPMLIAAAAHALSGQWRLSAVFLCYGIANGMLASLKG